MKDCRDADKHMIFGTSWAWRAQKDELTPLEYNHKSLEKIRGWTGEPVSYFGCEGERSLRLTEDEAALDCVKMLFQDRQIGSKD